MVWYSVGEKFVFKGRCENTVKVARCYLVTCIASGLNYVRRDVYPKFLLDSVANYPWITAGSAEYYEIRSHKNTDSFAAQRLPVADKTAVCDGLNLFKTGVRLVFHSAGCVSR